LPQIFKMTICSRGLEESNLTGIESQNEACPSHPEIKIQHPNFFFI